MTTWQIILFLGLCSIVSCKKVRYYDEQGAFLDTISDRINSKLGNVLEAISINGIDDNFMSFIDDIENMATGMKEQTMNTLPAPDAMGMVGMFDNTMGTLHKCRRAGKSKRLIKELTETAKEGISQLGTTMNKFIQKMKPLKENVAELALDLKATVDNAADKLLDAVIAKVTT